MFSFDEVFGGPQELFVHGFHPLSIERSRVLDLLAADTAVLHVLRGIVLVRGPAAQNPARTEFLPELRVLRVIGIFGLFFCIEVVEITEELVETMNRRQELVAIAQVVLTELARGVAERFQNVRDG